MDRISRQLFKFKESSDTVVASIHDECEPWFVLSVEDDINYQDILRLELDGLTVLNRPVSLLRANSATEATKILASNRNIAVILLDVVMEEDDAGLRLVSTIRDVLGNDAVRVILLTGQPSMAPRLDVMSQYDINDYWNKSDLTFEKLRVLITGNVRSWHVYHELEKARHSLQMLIDASQSLSEITDVVEFSNTLLHEIAVLTHAQMGGIVCAGVEKVGNFQQSEVIASTGPFKQANVKTLADVILINETTDIALTWLVSQAISQKQHHFDERLSVLYFEANQLGDYGFIMIINSVKPLSQHNINLMRAFCENIDNGFKKIALLNRLSILAYKDAELDIANFNWLVREISLLKLAQKKDTAIIFISIFELNEIELSTGHDYGIELLIKICEKLDVILSNNLGMARAGSELIALICKLDDLPNEFEFKNISSLDIDYGDANWKISTNIVVVKLAECLDYTANNILSLAKATLNRNLQNNISFSIYKSKIKEDILQRHRLILEMSRGLKNNEFYLVLQPKIRLSNQAVVGFEALLRWRKPDGEIIPPGVFIPVAESTGLITVLDSITLELTLQTVQQLCRAGYPLRVSFNSTADDLFNSSYLELLINRHKEMQVPASLLDIEITESVAMKNYSRINPILKLLESKGYAISIDDFGTGYSSLSHINKLNATNIKIDRSFVVAMVEDVDGEALTDIVLKVGQRFNFKVIAEGIETQQQYKMLLDKGCEFGQGFLFGKPMGISEVLKWLHDKPENLIERL